MKNTDTKAMKRIKDFYIGLRMSGRASGFLVQVCEYILYPEFRRRTIPFKRYAKIATAVIVVYVFVAISINNIVLEAALSDRQNEINRQNERISILHNNAKFVLYNECMDSVRTSNEYIRLDIYKSSGIMLPDMPNRHLQAIKGRCDSTTIPKFTKIYLRVIEHESGFDSSARNASGAFGYMQLMPGTFRHLSEVLSLHGGNTAVNNLICGSHLLKQNYEYWYKRKNSVVEAWKMALA